MEAAAKDTKSLQVVSSPPPLVLNYIAGGNNFQKGSGKATQSLYRWPQTLTQATRPTSDTGDSKPYMLPLWRSSICFRMQIFSMQNLATAKCLDILQKFLDQSQHTTTRF